MSSNLKTLSSREVDARMYPPNVGVPPYCFAITLTLTLTLTNPMPKPHQPNQCATYVWGIQFNIYLNGGIE